MIYHPKDNHNIPENSTFICSVPSWGNIGQLAVDILLSTLSVKNMITYLGSIESKNILPITGTEQLNRTSNKFLCMPIEAYRINDTDVIILQLRSPVITGRNTKFAKELTDLLTSYKFRRLLFLCGASLEVNMNDNILSNQLFKAQIPAMVVPSIDVNWQNLDEILQQLPDILLQTNSSGIHPVDMPPIPPLVNTLKDNDVIQKQSSCIDINWDELPYGIGIITDIMKIFTNRHQVVPANSNPSSDCSSSSNNNSILEAKKEEHQVIVFGKYCYEGDNTRDGEDLAMIILRDILKLDSKENIHNLSLSKPLSWNYLFGAPIPTHSNIYF